MARRKKIRPIRDVRVQAHDGINGYCNYYGVSKRERYKHHSRNLAITTFMQKKQPSGNIGYRRMILNTGEVLDYLVYHGIISYDQVKTTKRGRYYKSNLVLDPIQKIANMEPRIKKKVREQVGKQIMESIDDYSVYKEDRDKINELKNLLADGVERGIKDYGVCGKSVLNDPNKARNYYARQSSLKKNEPQEEVNIG